MGVGGGMGKGFVCWLLSLARLRLFVILGVEKCFGFSRGTDLVWRFFRLAVFVDSFVGARPCLFVFFGIKICLDSSVDQTLSVRYFCFLAGVRGLGGGVIFFCGS